MRARVNLIGHTWFNTYGVLLIIMYVDAAIEITTQMTQPHMRYYLEDKDMSVWELNVCANAVMHACVCACFKFACVQV